MAKKTEVQQQAPETTAPAQQSESIIWVDPFNPNNIQRFSSNEVKENFIKWQEEHKEYFYNFEIDQIIDLILNPFKNTTPEHQKSYKARLKIFYSKELEKVNDPIKRKTFESVLSVWDDLRLPTHFIIELNKLRQYLKNNSATPIDDTPEIKELSKKINWIDTPEKLRSHLEILMTNDFIYYTDIDSVLSGDETAVFIKNRKYKSIEENILSLFQFWNEEKYIKEFITTEDRKGVKEDHWHYGFIIESFNKGNIFKERVLKNSKKRMINEKSKNIIYDYFKQILTA